MSFTGIKHVESVEITEHSEGINITATVDELDLPPKESIYRAREITNFSKETLALLEECKEKYSNSLFLIGSSSMLDTERPNEIKLVPVKEPVPSAKSYDNLLKEAISNEPLFKTITTQVTESESESFEAIITQVNESESFEAITTQVNESESSEAITTQVNKFEFSEAITAQVNESECFEPHSILSRAHEYDTAPTELFQALEARQFDKALSILEDSSPEQIKDPNTLSGFEQANTWIYRKNEDNGEIRWRVLPLHAAVIFGAPIEVVDLIIDLSPISTKLVDDTGKLPIHLAFFKNADKKIIQKLLTVHPECVRVRDGKGRLPHECAVKEMELLSTYTEIVAHVERQYIINKFRGRQDREIAKFKNKLDKQVSKIKKSYEEKFAELKKIHDALEEEYLETREDSIRSRRENSVRGGGRENCVGDGQDENVKSSFEKNNNKKQPKVGLDEGRKIEEKLDGLQDGLKVIRNQLVKSHDTIKVQSEEARRRLETWKLEKMLLSIELEKDYGEIKNMKSIQVPIIRKEEGVMKVHNKAVEAE